MGDIALDATPVELDRAKTIVKGCLHVALETQVTIFTWLVLACWLPIVTDAIVAVWYNSQQKQMHVMWHVATFHYNATQLMTWLTNVQKNR